MNTNRLERLLALYTQNPNDIFVIYALAKEYESKEEYSLSEERFKEILNKDADYVGMYYHYGKLLWKLSRDEESIAMLDRGIHVAEKLGDKHALGELKQLRWEVSDED